MCVFRLGLVHDDDEKCRKFPRDKEHHVMEKSLGYSSNPWSWSACSRDMLTRLLE